MKVAIIGAGYVGLVTGVCLSELGNQVVCMDKDPQKISMLTSGEVPIFEPGLASMVKVNMMLKRLSFTDQLGETLTDADIVMIAVGTPPDAKEAGRADLSYVFACAEEIAQTASERSEPLIVVTKSTVPVGTNAEIKRRIAHENPDLNYEVASNPEFLREGSAIPDFMQPDRIIIGVDSEVAGARLSELYRPITNNGYPLLRTDVATAEMIKYASNSFLATKIAFINEMADICEQVGANVELVATGMGMDARIGDKFLNPGPGFGGSCFPKDALALARLAENAGVEPKIVNTVIGYNLSRRESMAQRVIDACGGDVKGKLIAVLGLTFKAQTDDMRESPALSIIPMLLEAGARIKSFDPQGIENARALLPDTVEYCESVEAAIAGADALTIVTEWREFRHMDVAGIKDQMKTPIIVDLRNLFAPEDMALLGYDYYSIGRKPARGFSGLAKAAA